MVAFCSILKLNSNCLRSAKACQFMLPQLQSIIRLSKLYPSHACPFKQNHYVLSLFLFLAPQYLHTKCNQLSKLKPQIAIQTKLNLFNKFLIYFQHLIRAMKTKFSTKIYASPQGKQYFDANYYQITFNYNNLKKYVEQ